MTQSRQSSFRRWLNAFVPVLIVVGFIVALILLGLVIGHDQQGNGSREWRIQHL